MNKSKLVVIVMPCLMSSVGIQLEAIKSLLFGRRYR